MIGTFALQLLTGMAFMWLIMPRRQVTSGFFRIQMLVTLGLSVLLALVYGQLTGSSHQQSQLLSESIARGLFVASAVVSFVGSTCWRLERRRGGDIAVFLLALLSTVTLVLARLPDAAMPTSAEWLLVASDLTAAALLGSAMTGMLLGHWYLTAPTMSILPLGRLNQFFGVAAILRGLVTAFTLPIFGSKEMAQLPISWLALRWGAGIVVPVILSLMVWRILKYRNTQSATGVLFVGVILTFVGEMTAMLLERGLQAVH